MAPRIRLQKIVKLSESLEVDPAVFIATGVLDPVLGVDVKMFVDPQRLLLTDVPEFLSARAKLEKYFADTFLLVSLAKAHDSSLMKTAVERLTFKETKGVGIGFGKDTNDGRGIGPELATRLVNTASKIQDLGKTDPAVFELLGLFEENFGADRLSDLTIVILREEFLAFTQRASKEMGISQTKEFLFETKRFIVPFREGTNVPLTLLPLDILRDLPIAMDPSEIQEAGYLNSELRECWKKLLAKAHDAGQSSPDKAVTKDMFLNNPPFFDALIKVYREERSGPYDFVRDPKGSLRWADFAMEFASRFPIALERKIDSLEKLEIVVEQVVKQFRENIEANGLNKLLYNNTKRPQREAYAQLLFFASASAYCRANGLDISPESDAGRGPVDFKISQGKLKVVVELKLSKNKRLLHGFETQLRIYQAAEQAQRAIFVVVKVAETEPTALEDIRRLIRNESDKGRISSKLIVIDGALYPSASKA